MNTKIKMRYDLAFGVALAVILELYAVLLYLDMTFGTNFIDGFTLVELLISYVVLVAGTLFFPLMLIDKLFMTWDEHYTNLGEMCSYFDHDWNECSRDIDPMNPIPTCPCEQFERGEPLRFVYGFKISARIKMWKLRRYRINTYMRRELVKEDGTFLCVVPISTKPLEVIPAYAVFTGAGLAYVVYSLEADNSKSGVFK